MTEKDKTFLETLKKLMDSKDLWVELKPGEPGYMILKGTYGQKVHKSFGVTRQGVRWRFHHLFSRTYVGAFETVVCIEKIVGTQLRDYAIRISRQRYELRQKALQASFRDGASFKQ